MLNLFCEQCGKIIKIKGEKVSCSCGFEKNSSILINQKLKSEGKGEGIASDKNTFATFPHVCKKCGNTEAELVDLGAPYSDEANIYLFICPNCGYVERQAEGSSNG